MTTDELIDLACPKIRDLGWLFYFVPETMGAGAELGLDGLQFYVLGRGGVLGDVEADVVVSAFGYFKASMIEAAWTAGREIVAPRDAGRAFLQCSAEFGRQKLSGVAGLEAFCAAAGAVNEAADSTALTLYAAVRCEPLADDPPARAMQLLTVLREFRGSAHLLAVRASGLDAKTANFVKRPDEVALFGWTTDEGPEITDEIRARHAAAEALTDQLVRPAYDVLDDAGRETFASGLASIESALLAPNR